EAGVGELRHLRLRGEGSWRRHLLGDHHPAHGAVRAERHPVALSRLGVGGRQPELPRLAPRSHRRPPPPASLARRDARPRIPEPMGGRPRLLVRPSHRPPPLPAPPLVGVEVSKSDTGLDLTSQGLDSILVKSLEASPPCSPRWCSWLRLRPPARPRTRSW